MKRVLPHRFERFLSVGIAYYTEMLTIGHLGGKKFRSVAQAEFHGSKTAHVNFSESTEEIAPLTEEQKKEKLAELRQKAMEKKAAQSEEDKLANKRNEVSLSDRACGGNFIDSAQRKSDAKARKRHRT